MGNGGMGLRGERVGMRGDMEAGSGEIFTFRLLEFASRPKESTRLCLVPLRTKNPPGFAWHPLGQRIHRALPGTP